MASASASADKVQAAIFDRIVELVPNATEKDLLLLAEAYAWAYRPNQSHGGGSSNSN